MLRIVLSQASRLCEPAVFDALSSQQWAAMSRMGSAQTLVSLRRFGSEESSPPASAQPAAAPGGAAGTSSPRGVQQWRQWVDAKIGEKLDGKGEEAAPPQQEPAAPAAAQPATAAATVAAEIELGAAATAQQELLRVPAVDEELRELLHPESRRSRRSVQDEIFDIVVPHSQASANIGSDAFINYKQLAQAKEAPRLFPGGSNKAEEVSPDRIHPYRLFYPGQLYAPHDLDPYVAKDAVLEVGSGRRAVQRFISRADVEACADFRNAQFLTSFVTEAGKLVPRRRTRLQQKVHRHLCRQVKVARIMAILPPESRLPQFQPRQRAPRAPPAPAPPRLGPAA